MQLDCTQTAPGGAQPQPHLPEGGVVDTPCYAAWCLSARSAGGHSGAVNSDDLADATRAAKGTEALLRDARSALRRVEKLADAALATDEAEAHYLAGAVQRMLEQLVDHLVLAKQKRNREVQRAVRKVR